MRGGEGGVIGHSNADLPAPDLGGISVELGDIFDQAGATDSPIQRPRPATVSALRPQRTGRGAITLIAVFAAGVAGLAIGALVIRTPSAPSAPGPVPVAQASAPQTETAVTPPLVAAEAASPPSTQGKSELAPARPASIALAKSRKARSDAARAPPRHPGLAMAQPASCEHDAAGQGCRRAVIQADRHLRDIYANAIRRGVPQAVLVDYRDRWIELLDTETDDPRRLIQGYVALAYDLGREVRDDQEENGRRRSPSGLTALANALLPWR